MAAKKKAAAKKEVVDKKKLPAAEHYGWYAEESTAPLEHWVVCRACDHYWLASRDRINGHVRNPEHFCSSCGWTVASERVPDDSHLRQFSSSMPAGKTLWSEIMIGRVVNGRVVKASPPPIRDSEGRRTAWIEDGEIRQRTYPPDALTEAQMLRKVQRSYRELQESEAKAIVARTKFGLWSMLIGGIGILGIILLYIIRG